MKKIARFVLGVLSSLLLAAGLARAADKVDPVSLTNSATDSVLTGAPECTTLCDIVDNDQ
jgi:hypothetical protein